MGAMDRLNGHICLVTGATGYIGEATVRRLAAEGARLVITDLSYGPCRELADELDAGGVESLPIALDVSSEDAWISATRDVQDRFGGLDVLVNNAGVGEVTTVETESLESWTRVIETTQMGVWLGMKHAGALIQASGGGSIVNVSSVFGTVGGFGDLFSYHAAKGAVRTMTKSAAVHWGPADVRVNSIHPGFIDTPRLRERLGDSPRGKATIDWAPLGRHGGTEEVAAAIAFLASTDSSFITGSEVYVDGGWTAR